MFDHSQRLRENPHLLFLLSHYAQLVTEDRATWQDRLMQMDGVEPKQLSALGSVLGPSFHVFEPRKTLIHRVAEWFTR